MREQLSLALGVLILSGGIALQVDTLGKSLEMGQEIKSYCLDTLQLTKRYEQAPVYNSLVLALKASDICQQLYYDTHEVDDLTPQNVTSWLLIAGGGYLATRRSRVISLFRAEN